MVDAFNYLVDRVEEKGIIVIKSSYIGNTHRVLDVKEFRGFVLYDDIAPVVFITIRIPYLQKYLPLFMKSCMY
jgi:hypothetical protein